MRFNSLVAPLNQFAMFTLAFDSPPGALVEVGVYRGGTASMLYSAALQQERELFLYDTFSGIPHQAKQDEVAIGTFGNTDAKAIKAAMPLARIIVGVFPQTFKPIGPIAFVHADADQYQSTKDIVETFKPYMVSGGVMLFDDWCLEGCKLALLETLGDPKEFVNERPVYRF